MPFCVAMGAMLMCPMGLAPGQLIVAEPNVTENTPLANIIDNKPFANVTPFGACTSMANPAVASATAAALGVLTPQPCTPQIPGPWAPSSACVLIRGKPAALSSSMLNCAYGGVITISNPNCTKVTAN